MRKAIAGVLAMVGMAAFAPGVWAEEDHLIGVQIKDLNKIKPGAPYDLSNAAVPWSAVGCDLKTAKFLLLSAEKNGADDPRGGQTGNFICYKAKCSDPGLMSLAADDQFDAAHSIELKKSKLVCAPFVDPDAPPAPRFVANGDGTVSDTQTGLMWEIKYDLGGVHDTDATYGWCLDIAAPYTSCDTAAFPLDGTVATAFLAILNGGGGPGTCLGGHCDWRLPTVEELESILDPALGSCAGGTGPCIDTSFFGPTQTGEYWSATTHASNPAAAKFVHFGTGVTTGTSKAYFHHVRAVRSGT